MVIVIKNKNSNGMDRCVWLFMVVFTFLYTNRLEMILISARWIDNCIQIGWYSLMENFLVWSRLVTIPSNIEPTAYLFVFLQYLGLEQVPTALLSVSTSMCNVFLPSYLIMYATSGLLSLSGYFTGNWNMPRIMLNLYPEYIFFIKN